MVGREVRACLCIKKTTKKGSLFARSMENCRFSGIDLEKTRSIGLAFSHEKSSELAARVLEAE